MCAHFRQGAECHPEILEACWPGGFGFEREIFPAGHHQGRLLANLLAEVAVFLIRK